MRTRYESVFSVLKAARESVPGFPTDFTSATRLKTRLFWHRGLYDRSTAIAPSQREMRCTSRFAASVFQTKRSDFVSACCKYDLQTYLVDCIVSQDKMTMATLSRIACRSWIVIW